MWEMAVRLFSSLGRFSGRGGFDFARWLLLRVKGRRGRLHFGVFLRRGLFRGQLFGRFLLLLEKLGDMLLRLAVSRGSAAIDADEIRRPIRPDRIAEAGIGGAANDRRV